MTTAEKFRALIPNLDPRAELSREMISDIADAFESGHLVQEEVLASLVSAVVTLDRLLIELDERTRGEVGAGRNGAGGAGADGQLPN